MKNFLPITLLAIVLNFSVGTMPAAAREDVSTPAFGDVAPGQAGIEKVFVTADGSLVVAQETGSVLPGFPVMVPGQVFVNSPLVLDTDGNGTLEIAVLSRDQNDEYFLNVYNSDATVVTALSLGANAIYFDPVIQKSVENAASDVVLPFASGVIKKYHLTAGVLEPTTLFTFNTPAGLALNSSRNILVVNYPLLKKLSVYTLANNAWQLSKTIVTPAEILYPPSFNGDTAIFAVGKDKKLYGYKTGDGSLLTGFPTLLSESALGGPVVTDADTQVNGNEIVVPLNSGKNEIVNLTGAKQNQTNNKAVFIAQSGTAVDHSKVGFFKSVGNFAVKLFKSLETRTASVFGKIRLALAEPPIVIIDNNSVVYEDAEDGLTTGWTLVQNVAGSSITNVDSGDQTHRRVIALTQLDPSKSFNFSPTAGQPWDYQNYKTFSFDAKFAKNVQYFLLVNTTGGVRYLGYGTNYIPGKSGSAIKFLLDPSFKDGAWHTVTRDLQKDIESYEPGVTITGLTYFNVLGTGQIDNFKLSRGQVFGNISGVVTDGNNAPLPGVVVSVPGSQLLVQTDANGKYAVPSLLAGTYNLTYTKFGYDFAAQVATIPPDGTNQILNVKSAVNDQIVYEDAEDGLTNGWSFVQNVAGSSITNVDSGDLTHKRVIALTQLDSSKSFSFNPIAGQPWDYKNFKIFSFDAKFSKDVQYFMFVNTTGGVRYLAYGTNYTSGKSGNSIRFKLDPIFKDGAWHTITRDLQKDLESYEPGVTITSLTYFNVQGTGQIDNFKLSRGTVYGNITGVVTDSLGVPLPGVAVYTPGSQVVVQTDANGYYAVPSLPVGTYTLTFTKFGYAFADKLVTIPADGVNQVVNIASGVTNEIVYEDAENGDTVGWVKVQNLPGSTITNVDSGDQAHKRVIDLFQLDSSKSFNFNPIISQPWDYQNYKILAFDTKFSKDVQYFIFAQTTAGPRYLAYGTKLTPGKSGSTLKFLLGPEYKDGTWKTIARDLQADVTSLEPGVTITSLSYLNVQGTGQIDNFKLKKSL